MGFPAQAGSLRLSDLLAGHESRRLFAHFDGRFIALSRGGIRPHVGLGVVQEDAAAGEVEGLQVGLGVDEAVAGGRAEPAGCLARVGGDAAAFVDQDSECVLGV